jgi:intracellular sulfur oxidation DsrE/DsrF family protein
MKPYRVIFHVSEDSEQATNEAFNNLRNLLADLGENQVKQSCLPTATEPEFS